MQPSFLRLEGLSKSFAQGVVLGDFDLEVRRGEVVALLGPSGSGKTTALRLVAGFETPDSGRIWLDGADITRLRPERRGCGMVFQSYALFPHLTVGQNVAFGLRGDEAAKGARVAEVLDLVRLAGLEPRRIAELSGGMQQRVALARALAPRPRVLLLDEPLSNLDPALREGTRRELRAAIDEVGITTVLVTHEQEEAFDLADRVAVLHGGRLEQVGAPEDLYDRPATPFVAAFIGRSSPLPGRLVDAATVELELEGSGGVRPRWPVLRADGHVAGAAVEVWARPSALDLRAAGSPGEGAIAGRVVARRFGRPLGSFRVEISVGATHASPLPPGARQTAIEIEVAASPEAVRVGELVDVVPRLGATFPVFPRPTS